MKKFLIESLQILLMNLLKKKKNVHVQDIYIESNYLDVIN